MSLEKWTFQIVNEMDYGEKQTFAILFSQLAAAGKLFDCV